MKDWSQWTIAGLALLAIVIAGITSLGSWTSDVDTHLAALDSKADKEFRFVHDVTDEIKGDIKLLEADVKAVYLELARLRGDVEQIKGFIQGIDDALNAKARE